MKGTVAMEDHKILAQKEGNYGRRTVKKPPRSADQWGSAFSEHFEATSKN
jgi:hypothetical protein